MYMLQVILRTQIGHLHIGDTCSFSGQMASRVKFQKMKFQKISYNQYLRALWILSTSQTSP